jgi:hypothetical protein
MDMLVMGIAAAVGSPLPTCFCACDLSIAYDVLKPWVTANAEVIGKFLTIQPVFWVMGEVDSITIVMIGIRALPAVSGGWPSAVAQL